MNETLAPLLRRSALVFFDDILIYSQSFQDQVIYQTKGCTHIGSRKFSLSLLGCNTKLYTRRALIIELLMPCQDIQNHLTILWTSPPFNLYGFKRFSIAMLQMITVRNFYQLWLSPLSQCLILHCIRVF
jgi:hypothetical protein